MECLGQNQVLPAGVEARPPKLLRPLRWDDRSSEVEGGPAYGAGRTPVNSACPSWHVRVYGGVRR